jgi:hypothetical protein
VSSRERDREQTEGERIEHVEYINQMSNSAESRSNLREVYSKILVCCKIVIKFWCRKLKFFQTYLSNRLLGKNHDLCYSSIHTNTSKFQ